MRKKWQGGLSVEGQPPIDMGDIVNKFEQIFRRGMVGLEILKWISLNKSIWEPHCEQTE